MKIMGIDEAGRGPVIGSMFMACVLINKDEEHILKEWGVKDSKMLSKEKRAELYQKIIERFEYKVVSFSPSEIDVVLAPEHPSNLNRLEAQGQAELINAYQVSKVFVDCPSINPAGYTQELAPLITDEKIELIVENKADVNYLVVAAASIIAKEHREMEVKELHSQVGIDFGSGYLTDPKTKPFLEQHWKTYPQVFRQGWAPYKKLKAAAAQQSLGSFSK